MSLASAFDKMDKYDALMGFLLELDGETLGKITAAAESRFEVIATMVERNPLTPASATECVLEDFLHRVDDYLAA